MSLDLCSTEVYLLLLGVGQKMLKLHLHRALNNYLKGENLWIPKGVDLRLGRTKAVLLARVFESFPQILPIEL